MVARLMAVVALAVATATVAQADEPKHGGILHIYHRETPPSLSIHEEATFSVNVPAMGASMLAQSTALSPPPTISTRRPWNRESSLTK